MKPIIPLIVTAATVTIALAVGINHSKNSNPSPQPSTQIIKTDQTNSNPKNTIQTSALVPLEIKYPAPIPGGTPKAIAGIPNMEPKPTLGTVRPPFMVPDGTTNIAMGKQIYSSDEDPMVGSIDMINDGNKDGNDGSYVELAPGRQHVTIDLGAQHDIYALSIWHYHKHIESAKVYFDVIVQTADDQDFINNVQTLFNNDHDNSSGMGIGKDKNYIQTNRGKLINAKGIQGRYVRLYGNGNSDDELNRLIEVEVYGKPTSKTSTKAQGHNGRTNSVNTDILVPLKIKYPQPIFCSTPIDLKKIFKTIPNLDITSINHDHSRPPMMVPKGTTNIAMNKTIYSTDDNPIVGHIDMITDSDKEGSDGSYIEMGPGQQHVTIDLGDQYNIYAIAVWHFHKMYRIYFDVIVQSASDEDFVNSNILFNNDIDNTIGLGCGTDKNYFETNYGKLINAKGVQGRYIRLYSNGNNNSDLNHYTEIEVYGKAIIN